MTGRLLLPGTLAGDVFTGSRRTASCEGGADTINGGNLRDAHRRRRPPMKVSRLVGGNDTIHGNGGDDLIAGDCST